MLVYDLLFEINNNVGKKKEYKATTLFKVEWSNQGDIWNKSYKKRYTSHHKKMRQYHPTMINSAK